MAKGDGVNLDVQAIYDRRYQGDQAFRARMWVVLCQEFFQSYVPPNISVLELGAAHCGFINSIRAARKTVVDLNPDVRRFAGPDVQTILSSVTDLSAVPAGSMDVVFASNLFEHLSRADIVQTVRECRRVLRPSGSLLLLQPNIRLCGRDYWMFFDHITPLDERSMAEALETNGFAVVQTIPAFLPYTTKGRLPKSVALLRAYLRMPLLWRFVGGQFFLQARPRGECPR